jgi:starch phosphorylase
MRRPFSMLQPRIWIASNENPLAVLRATSDAYLEQRLHETAFKRALDAAITARDRDDRRERWFDRARQTGERAMCIAYVCSEFAIHECMQQYSGGLGVLAGSTAVLLGPFDLEGQLPLFFSEKLAFFGKKERKTL